MDEHGRLESGVLPGKGSGEWQTLETDAGHVRLPVNTEGYVLAPLDQFKTNPIVKDMANRRLLDTTFIFSGLGGETGPVVIDNICRSSTWERTIGCSPTTGPIPGI